MSRRTLLVGGLIAVALAFASWKVATRSTPRTAPSHQPAGSSDTVVSAGSAGRSARLPERAPTLDPGQPDRTGPIPTAPADPAPVPEEIEAPPDVVTAIEAGKAVLRKASGKCVRDVKQPAKGAVRFAVEIVVAKQSASSKKVEVLDRGGQSEAFDACMVNELADLSWPVTIPDGKMTFEYSLELAELGK